MFGTISTMQTPPIKSKHFICLNRISWTWFL